MAVGSRSACPNVGYCLDVGKGQGDEVVTPWRDIILRTREKPFEWIPVELRPSNMSPCFISDNFGRRRDFDTAPTAKPARS